MLKLFHIEDVHGELFKCRPWNPNIRYRLGDAGFSTANWSLQCAGKSSREIFLQCAFNESKEKEGINGCFVNVSLDGRWTDPSILS